MDDVTGGEAERFRFPTVKCVVIPCAEAELYIILFAAETIIVAILNRRLVNVIPNLFYDTGLASSLGLD